MRSNHGAAIVLVSLLLAVAAHAAVDILPIRQGCFVEITDAATGGYVVESFAMSDNGAKVAVVTRQADNSTWALRLVNTSGSGETVIASGSWTGPRPAFGPAISDDGSTVLWYEAIDPVYLTGRIKLYNAAKATVTTIVDTVPQSVFGVISDKPIYVRSTPALSGDGSLAVFLNTFGPQGNNSDGHDVSSFTFYAVDTHTSEVQPVLESRHLTLIAGISPNANILWGSAQLNYDGSVMTCTPVGLSLYDAKHVLILSPSSGKAGASILIDTDGMTYRGGALNGEGDLFVFSRYGAAAPEPRGLQVIPVDGSWPPMLIDEGQPEHGRYPTNPDINSAGTAVSWQFDIGGGSTPTFRFARLDTEGVIPLFNDAIAGPLHGDFGRVSFISSDESTVVFGGRVRYDGESRPMNICVFRWISDATRPAGVPAVTTLRGSPRTTFVRQVGGWYGLDPLTYAYSTSGAGSGYFHHMFFDDTGRWTDGINGHNYRLVDNGLYGDAVAGDGIFTNPGLWARETVLVDTFTARGTATSPNRTAAFADFRIRVCDILEDVNSDGQVNALDVQSVINEVLGLGIDLEEADVNGDGQVNALDVQTVINKVLGV